MCLAIFKPKGAVIPDEHLANGFKNNPDGAGFAYVKDGRVVVKKGYFESAQLIRAFKAKVGSGPALLHFRWATHGKRTPFNCHPWSVLGGEYAVVHNGILPIVSTEQMSDTGHYVEQVLEPAFRKFGDPNDPALRFLVETSIGDSNKIAVMDAQGRATIYNEEQGEWVDGTWYSNDGYRASRWDWHGYPSTSYEIDHWDGACQECGMPCDRGKKMCDECERDWESLSYGTAKMDANGVWHYGD